MHIALLLVLVLLLVFGPQWWARYTFRRYAGASPNVPGTGAELARHLLNRFGMSDVGVETAEPGADHYDPEQRVVRLGPDHLLMAASAPRSADAFRARGYTVTEVDIGEFERLEGCVTCLSVRVRG